MAPAYSLSGWMDIYVCSARMALSLSDMNVFTFDSLVFTVKLPNR